jgi:hypothetical protein
MRKIMRYKSTSHKRSLATKKIEDVGKEIAARFLASVKKALGADTLEGVHRVSWRHYLLLLWAPVACSFILSSVSLAAVVSTEAPAGKLVSKESVQKSAGVSKAKKATKKQDEKKTKEMVVEKTVNGTIVFIRKNNMSVEFASGEAGGEELYLKLDKKVKLQHIKEFSKLKRGDQVSVKYLETYLEPEKKGDEPIVLSMVGTQITLVKSAVNGAQNGPTSA